MVRYKVRLALLTLGMVFGYGSAIAHVFGYGPIFARHSHHCAWE